MAITLRSSTVFDTDQSQAEGLVSSFIKNSKKNPQGDFSAGLRSGWESLKASGHGLAGAAGSLVGADEFAADHIQQAQELSNQAAHDAPRVTDISEAESLGDVVDWLQGQIGQQLPMMGAVIAGGAVGRAGAAIASRAVPGLAGGLNPAIGQTVGSAASTMGLETGGIFNDLQGSDEAKANHSNAGLAAYSMLGGGLAGALDTLPVAELLGGKAPASLLGKVGRAGLEEAGTEGLQTIIERTTGSIAGGDDVFSAQGIGEILNAMAAGGALGGLTSGVLGGMPGEANLDELKGEQEQQPQDRKDEDPFADDGQDSSLDTGEYWDPYSGDHNFEPDQNWTPPADFDEYTAAMGGRQADSSVVDESNTDGDTPSTMLDEGLSLRGAKEEANPEARIRKEQAIEQYVTDNGKYSHEKLRDFVQNLTKGESTHYDIPDKAYLTEEANKRFNPERKHTSQLEDHLGDIQARNPDEGYSLATLDQAIPKALHERVALEYANLFREKRPDIAKWLENADPTEALKSFNVLQRDEKPSGIRNGDPDQLTHRELYGLDEHGNNARRPIMVAPQHKDDTPGLHQFAVRDMNTKTGQENTKFVDAVQLTRRAMRKAGVKFDTATPQQLLAGFASGYSSLAATGATPVGKIDDNLVIARSPTNEPVTLGEARANKTAGKYKAAAAAQKHQHDWMHRTLESMRDNYAQKKAQWDKAKTPEEKARLGASLQRMKKAGDFYKKELASLKTRSETTKQEAAGAEKVVKSFESLLTKIHEDKAELLDLAAQIEQSSGIEMDDILEEYALYKKADAETRLLHEDAAKARKFKDLHYRNIQDKKALKSLESNMEKKYGLDPEEVLHRIANPSVDLKQVAALNQKIETLREQYVKKVKLWKEARTEGQKARFEEEAKKIKQEGLATKAELEKLGTGKGTTTVAGKELKARQKSRVQSDLFKASLREAPEEEKMEGQALDWHQTFLADRAPDYQKDYGKGEFKPTKSREKEQGEDKKNEEFDFSIFIPEEIEAEALDAPEPLPVPKEWIQVSAKAAALEREDAAFVAELSKKLGIDFSFASSDMLLNGNRVFNPDSTMDLLDPDHNLNGLSSADGKYVSVSPSLTDKAERRHVLMHEIGHAVLTYHQQNAVENQADLDALHDAWMAWRSKFSKDSNATDVIVSKKSFVSMMRYLSKVEDPNIKLGDLPRSKQEYLLDFHEWFADNVNRVLAKDFEPKSTLDQFFSKVADALRSLYEAAIRKFGLEPNETVEQFVRKVIDRQAGKARVQALHNYTADLADLDPSNDPKEKKRAKARKTAAGAASHRAPGSTGALDALEQAYEDILKPSQRGVLLRAFNSSHIINQMRKLLTPEQMAVLRKDPKKRMLLGYQMWQKGDLNIGPETKGVFHKMRTLLEKHAGLVDDRTMAERMLEVIRKGQAKTLGTGESLINRSMESKAKNAIIDNIIGAGKHIDNLWGKVGRTAIARMHNTGNPYLIKLADAFHGRSGAETVGVGYLNAKTMQATRFNKKVERIWPTNLEEAELETLKKEVLESLRDPSAKASAKVKKLREKVRNHLQGMHKYMTDSGVTIGDLGADYFPWVFSTEQISERSDEFKKLLLQGKFADGVARAHLMAAQEKGMPINEKAYNDLLKTKEFSELTEADVQAIISKYPGQAQVVEDLVMGLVNNEGVGENVINPNRSSHTPFTAAVNSRKLGFVQKDGSADDMKALNGFMSDSIDATLLNYTEQAVKRAEFVKHFGEKGEGIDAMLKEAKRTGASEAELRMAQNFVDAMQGTLGIETNKAIHSLLGLEAPPEGQVIDPTLQKTMGGMMVMNNLAYLGLSTLSSLVDPVGILVRSNGNIGLAWKSFVTGVRETFPNITGLEGKAVNQSIAEMLGLIEDSVSSDALRNGYGGNHLTGTSRWVNDKLFEYNGLQQWTNSTRIMAVAGARQFLKFHADGKGDSRRFLEQLGLAPKDIRIKNGETLVLTDTQVNNLLKRAGKTTDMEARKKLLDEVARDERVRRAVFRFANEAILRPNAATRPIWGSDPHFMLLHHMKSFMFAFQEQILQRVWKEFREQGNVKPALALGAFVPIQLMVNLLRDEVKYPGDDEPKNKENWGLTEYLYEATEKAGLFGVTHDWYAHVKGDLERGDIPGKSLLGPAPAWMLDGVKAVSRNGKGVGAWLEEELPLHSVWSNW